MTHPSHVDGKQATGGIYSSVLESEVGFLLSILGYAPSTLCMLCKERADSEQESDFPGLYSKMSAARVAEA